MSRRPTVPEDEFIGRLTREGAATDEGRHAAADPQTEQAILGLLQRDEHRVDPMRQRWLRSWVSSSPSGARLLGTIWASQWFHPFLTFELANSAINTDKAKVFVRLSSSVPGHVTVSFWNQRSRQPHHVRIGPIFEDGRLMFEGRRHGIEDILDYITNRNSSETDGATNATSCPVCKDTMHGKRTLVSDCGHSFCEKCIHDFWDYGGRNCPLCRARWNGCPRRQSIIGQISPRSKISVYASWIPMDKKIVAAERVRLGLSHSAADFFETESIGSEDPSGDASRECDSSACYLSGPEFVPPPPAARPAAGNADADDDGGGERVPPPRLPLPAVSSKYDSSLQSRLLYAGIFAGFAAMLALRLRAP